MVSARVWVPVLPVCLLVLTQCSGGEGGGTPSTIDPGNQSGSSSQAGTSTSSGGANSSAGTLGIELGGSQATAGSSAAGTAGTSGEDTSGCGDGVLQAAQLGEVCDDGNSESGDGCSADCKVIEQGYSCLTPGMPCESTVMCGDGTIGGTETCDDGNDEPGDGCSATCEPEMGWLCPTAGDPCVAAQCGDGIIAGVEQCEDNDAVPTSGDGCSKDCALEPGFVCETPKQACRQAVCGDGKIEGGEPCDDMNTVVGDGCSPGCEAEPICTKPSDADGCSSSCGDGLLIDGDDEECDDGNKRDGDGCSSLCKVELGYMCEKQAGALPATISIPFVFRDFIAFPSMTTTRKRHPDFQARCVGQQANGMVSATLDAMGKPVNSNSCNLVAACTIDNGYIDPVNGDHCAEHESCPAGFDSCDQLHALHPVTGFPGDPFNYWYRTTTGMNHEKVQPTTLTLTNGRYTFNSGALFPFDNGGWVQAGDEIARNGHNFGFTSEVRRWFTFNGGELLTFNGDDDVWVFLNGKLAMDLGGVHQVETRTIRLNADGTVDCKIGEPNGMTTFAQLTNCATAQRDLDLIQGKVYEIALFHAERHSDASNFRLALTGFVSAKSKCTPKCGDGTQTPGESCDNGTMNDDDAYNGCTTMCRRGPRCGDGVQQAADMEQCDDGKNLTPYSTTLGMGCAPGCKLPAYCGDAKLDSLFGEKCDDGTNAGGYGGCNPDCTLGPRCGDGKVDSEHEGCDDGNSVSGDGCSAMCKKEMPK